MGFIAIMDGIKWLTMMEMLLCLLNLIVFIKLAVPVMKSYRWLDYVPGLSVLIAIASILTGNMTLLAIVIYSMTGLVFLGTAKQLFKPTQQANKLKFKVIRAILGICGIFLIILALSSAGELRYNPTSQFSSMTYSQAFSKMNQRLSREYPFGAWKRINWHALERKYEPLFKKAEIEKDPELYYKTLRQYLFSFRDGHIQITNENLYEDNKIFKAEAGGGFGLSTRKLDNGKVLVSLVLKDTPAEQSGIKVGTEIIKWDGKEAKQAFSEVVWSEKQAATDEDRRIDQGRFLVRAPIGKEIQVEYRNEDEFESRLVTLTAYDDQYETLLKTKVKLSKEDASVEGKVLNKEYGYLQVRYFLPSKQTPKPETYLKEQLQAFQAQKLKGLILDLRDNPGGLDDLAAAMAGYFVKEEKHYEYASYYNHNLHRFELDLNGALTVQPQKTHYTGKVVILINSKTGSSGEGIPQILKGLPNVTIVGFTATNGSFGIISSPIRFHMPEGYIVLVPDGRSLNKNNVIQVDSNDTGQGGVAPDIKIPFDEAAFKAKYVLGQDVELNYAMKVLDKE